MTDRISDPITGGCACGAIRYECAAKPVFSVHCQCRDCQRFTGAGHFSGLFVPIKAVTLTGTPRYFVSIADSGKEIHRGFCPDCGCPVFGKQAVRPQFGVLPVGSLDDPAQFKPDFVVYASRGHDWDAMDPALPSFPTTLPRKRS